VLACGTCTAGHALKESTPLKIDVTENAVTRTAWLTIDDIKGSYTIPYIQSARDLAVEVSFTVERVKAWRRHR